MKEYPNALIYLGKKGTKKNIKLMLVSHPSEVQPWVDKIALVFAATLPIVASRVKHFGEYSVEFTLVLKGFPKEVFNVHFDLIKSEDHLKQIIFRIVSTIYQDRVAREFQNVWP